MADIITNGNMLRKCLTEASALEQLNDKLVRLNELVSELSYLYDQHPELNDLVSLGKLTPMSLDEWSAEINTWLHP